MRAANAAAAVVVGKRGTATVSVSECASAYFPPRRSTPEEKIIFDWSVLEERLTEWRRQSVRIGFTNGCFDILHRGHIKLLTKRALPATVSWSVSTTIPRCGASRAQRGQPRTCTHGLKCWPLSKRSIW